MRTLCFFSLLLLGAQGAPGDEVLLYAPFDGQAEARFAQGDKTAITAIPPEYRPGVRGQALVVGGSPAATEETSPGLPRADAPGRNVCYAADKNIDVENGTISFWLKPLDWSGDSNGFNVLLRTQAGAHHFMIYKFFSREQLLFLRGAHEQWTSVSHRIGHWKPGQWRHIAITWSPVEIRLFIDGAMVCAERVRYPLENPQPVEPISVGPGGSWANAYIGRSLIDELRIHGRPLAHQEVVELYQRDAARVTLDTGHITLGMCTPEIDGRIGDFEYRFGGTGLADLKGMISTRQSRYFLGYDRQHLYVAMQSDIPASAAGQPPQRPDDLNACERVELFLVTQDEPERLSRLVFTPGGDVGEFTPEGVQWGATPVRARSIVENRQWTLEAAIPFSQLGTAEPPDGRQWRVNMGRVFTSPAEVTSVAPVSGTLADRGKFMELRFRPDAPAVHVSGLFDLPRHRAAYDISARCDDPQVRIEYIGISDTTGSYGLRVSKHALFAEGQSTPFRAPKPPAAGWPLVDFALYEARIAEQRNGRNEVLYRARFMYERQSPLETLFLYTLDRQRLSVTARRRADGDIRVRFLQPDGAVAWEAQQTIPTGATIFSAVFDLDFERLAPGDYTVKVEHVAPGGNVTETHEQAYRVPTPDAPAFRKYVDPEADLVPAPWVPLETEGESVSMWGRRYDCAGGFLVSSLQSRGHELLTAPAALRLNGRPLEPQKPVPVRTISSSPLHVTWEKHANLGPLKVTSHITTHFDGYCEVAMTLAPTEAACDIQSLSLDFPLCGKLASLVRDNRIGALTGSKTGAVGDYWCQKLVDNPFIWVGCEKAGLNWLAPTLENWHCRVHPKNVEILREADTAILRFNLVDTRLLLREPRTIRFGFMLTPSRPLDPAIHRCRLERDWEMWCQPWRYFAVPDYDTADRGLIERRGEGVKEVFLYLGDGFISPFSPEWPFFEQEWRELRPARTYGEWTGGDWTGPLRARCSYTEACVMSETFRNYVNHTRANFFARAAMPLTPKAIHYYFDTGVTATLCSNAHHGCAPYETIDGGRYGLLPIDERRELAINAYRMIRRTGPNAKIMSHQGWTRCMPLQHFTDVILGGEGVGSQVGNAGNYFDLLTPEIFRATYSPYAFGVKMVFLDMTVRAMKENRPERLLHFSLDDSTTRRALLHSYGYCVLHDVDIHDAAAESRPLRERLWQAQDALGWNEQVQFHPYWERGAVAVDRPESDRILASAYTKNCKMLLAVLNDTDVPCEVALALDLEALGIPPGAQGADIFDPESTAKLAPSCSLAMPPRGFRLLLVE